MNRRQPEIPRHPDSIPGEYTYKYPRPSVAADCIIFGFDGNSLKLLLIERGNPPFLGHWALPGGFMHQDESIEECAARELREETNLSDVYLEQFKVFSDPDRDPRGRVISIAFIALVRPSDFEIIAGDDAANAHWFDADQLPPLAFDHKNIVVQARERLKEILHLKPIAFNLLNKYFSLGELQKVYEVINDTTYDRRNFTRSVQDAGIVEATDVKPVKARNRPPRLYRASSRIIVQDTQHEQDLSIEVNEEMVECEYVVKPDMTMMGDFGMTDKPMLDEMEEADFAAKNIVKESPTKGLFDFLRRYLK